MISRQSLSLVVIALALASPSEAAWKLGFRTQGDSSPAFIQDFNFDSFEWCKKAALRTIKELDAASKTEDGWRADNTLFWICVPNQYELE